MSFSTYEALPHLAVRPSRRDRLHWRMDEIANNLDEIFRIYVPINRRYVKPFVGQGPQTIIDGENLANFL